MKTANLFKTVLTVLLITFLASCSKDEDPQKNQSTFKVKANYLEPRSFALKSNEISGVVLNDFKVNIGEIEVEFDDDDPLFASDSVASDYELEGPFEVQLLNGGNPLSETIANNVELPTATYDEIEFEFRESENSSSEMLGKSILIKGTIDGTPFVFWSDEEMELEIELDELALINDASNAMFTISFDLTTLFDASNGGIDITSASDRNANGIIEIHPDDPDGNSDLGETILEKIEEIIEAFEEEYND